MSFNQQYFFWDGLVKEIEGIEDTDYTLAVWTPKKFFPLLTRPHYSNSRLPSNARANVTSSAYSKSPPIGKPKAIRVTFVKGLNN